MIGPRRPRRPFGQEQRLEIAPPPRWVTAKEDRAVAAPSVEVDLPVDVSWPSSSTCSKSSPRSRTRTGMFDVAQAPAGCRARDSRRLRAAVGIEQERDRLVEEAEGGGPSGAFRIDSGRSSARTGSGRACRALASVFAAFTHSLYSARIPWVTGRGIERVVGGRTCPSPGDSRSAARAVPSGISAILLALRGPSRQTSPRSARRSRS